MSDGVHQLINQIGERAKHFHGLYVAAQSENDRLNGSVKSLQSQLTAKNAELEELNEQLVALKQKMEATKQHDVDSVKLPLISEAEIDELVKEIDDCLARLKQ